MKRGLLVLSLCSILAYPLLSQAEKSLFLRTYQAIFDRIPEKNRGVDRATREKEILDFAQAQLAASGQRVERFPLRVPAAFSIFSEGLAWRPPLPSVRTVTFLFPLHTAPDENADDRVAVATFLSLASLIRPDQNIELCLLGGQYRSEDQFGVQAWLYRNRGNFPRFAVYVDLPSLPDRLRWAIPPDSAIVSAPLLTRTKDLIGSKLPASFNQSAYWGGRLVQVENPLEDGFSKEGVAILTLTVDRKGSNPEPLLGILTGLPDILGTSRPEDGGSHFLFFPWVDNAAFIAEQTTIIVLVVFGGGLVLLTWFLRRRYLHGFKVLVNQPFMSLAFVAATTLSSLLAWLLAAGVTRLFGQVEWWNERPIVGLSLELVTSNALFLIFYGVGLGRFIPANPRVYGLIANLAALSMLILVTIKDVGLFWILAPLFFLTLPVFFSHQKVATLIRLITAAVAIGLALIVITWGRDGTAIVIRIRDDALLSILGVGTANTCLLALLFARVSMRSANRDDGGRVRRLLRTWVVVISGLLVLGYLGTSVFIERPNRLFVSYFESSPSAAKVEIRRQGTVDPTVLSLGGLSWRPGDSQTQSVSQLPSRVSAQISIGTFLSRKQVRILVKNLEPAQSLSIELHAPEEIRLLQSSIPPDYLRPTEVSFNVGPYPPQEFLLTFEVPASFQGTVLARFHEVLGDRLTVAGVSADQVLGRGDFFRVLGTID